MANEIDDDEDEVDEVDDGVRSITFIRYFFFTIIDRISLSVVKVKECYVYFKYWILNLN